MQHGSTTDVNVDDATPANNDCVFSILRHHQFYLVLVAKMMNILEQYISTRERVMVCDYGQCKWPWRRSKRASCKM
jgi:hypothetical protein